MPTYYYTAKTLAGEIKSGIQAAKDERALARLLREEGFFLLSAESREKAVKPSFNILATFQRGVPLTEKIFFTRYLAVMLAAGVPITRALELLARQAKNKKFKETITHCAEVIQKGGSLAQSFSGHPQIFSELFVSMVKVGEEGGNLEEVLNILADQMQKDHDLLGKIKGAMMYPLIILIAMGGIGFFMIITVVPKLSEVFKELGIDLPPTTQFVIFFGNLLAKYWYLFPLLILISLFLLRLFLRTGFGRKLMAKVLLLFPLFKDLVKKINSARSARILSALIKGGVPIIRAVEITSRTVSNYFFQRSLEDIAKKVEKGKRLYESFAEHPKIFPGLMIEMFEVGEETGTLSDTLLRLSDFYDQDISRTTDNISSIIEPILMIFIGAAVGFFAISMIQPMYSMLDAL